MIVTARGEAIGTVGGGCVDGEVYSEAKKVLEEDRPRTITVDLTGLDDPDHGLICGGKVDVFLEPLVSPRLYICGAGHIGAALAQLARPLDFKVIVLDDRERFLNDKRFPGCELKLAPFQQTLEALRAQSPAYVAIVTRGHTYDQECLEWALAQGVSFPHSCRVGTCGTCRCRLVSGKVYELACGEPLS